MADPRLPDETLTDWEREWLARQASDRRDPRPILRSIWRGFTKRCPRCGKGRVLSGFLKPARSCQVCTESYAAIRTDDLAPWLCILLLGHLLLPLIITVERLWAPPFWVHIAVWIPLGAEMAFVLLPRAKGMALGLMWALRLRGDEHQH